MQAVAREFNFAESTFVTRPEGRAGEFNVRIFTPKTELRFAGHPTVGTACVLAHLGLAELQDGAGHMVLKEGVGPVDVAVASRPWGYHGELALAGPLERPAEEPDLGAVAAVLSLPRDAVLAGWHASVGLPFCFARLRDAAAVDAAVLDRAAWRSRLALSWAPQVFMFAGDPMAGQDLHARMFAPALGIDEDPATGSACAALAGLAASMADKDAELAFDVRQGVAMGRPSLMRAVGARAGGKLVRMSVGGGTVVVADGSIEVPEDARAG